MSKVREHVDALRKQIQRQKYPFELVSKAKDKLKCIST